MPSQRPETILQRLDWTVIRRLDGLLQGDYRTLFRGFGLELADLREYQFGDDIRYIDWNVTARMQTPYVREYMEEREVTAWFLLDLSPSVNFGTARMLKRNLLIDFVAVLARVLTTSWQPGRCDALHGQDGADDPAAKWRAQVLRHHRRSARTSHNRAHSPHDRSVRPPGGRLWRIPAAITRLHRLRFHQRARLGETARHGWRSVTRCWRPAVRPARDGVARRWAAGSRGRGDGRAALRRHAR